MKSPTAFVLLLGFALFSDISVIAQETTKKTDRILNCDGHLSIKGIRAPEDALIPSSSSSIQTYTIIDNANTLIVSGGGTFPDDRLKLCKTTSTHYLFSSDCTANRADYISDWLATKDFDINTSPFFKKYADSAYNLALVSIDRVNLQIIDEKLNAFTRLDIEKAEHTLRVKPYLTSGQFEAKCVVASPKI